MINSKLKNRNLNQVNVFNFSELFKLMKPRVMSLVIFTCAVGLLMAPSTVSTKDAMIAILLVSIGAGAAGALNMWYESDLDALMTRTCLRPIPMGKVNKNQALIFGTSLSFFSVIALDYFANTISAVLLLFTILFYVFVYTIWLKRKTPQNIVIGGAAGALPPVIGWTIATNSLSLEPITFFLIIFFWTPSHFWALSLYKSDDYKKAKIPINVVDVHTIINLFCSEQSVRNLPKRHNQTAVVVDLDSSLDTVCSKNLLDCRGKFFLRLFTHICHFVTFLINYV